ncbi:hypothetical protein, partial [Shewanella atlantica]|uniref:hypothetical protein n=1 Tax=Shewanella atlantica TaxID=271099 RepID=UPI0037365DAF
RILRFPWLASSAFKNLICFCLKQRKPSLLVALTGMQLRLRKTGLPCQWERIIGNSVRSTRGFRNKMTFIALSAVLSSYMATLNTKYEAYTQKRGCKPLFILFSILILFVRTIVAVVTG